MAKRRKFINPFKGLSGGSSSALNNGEDNVSIQGNEPNVDSFSNTQSGNAIERQAVRKPNVEKDQGKITKPNVSNVSESSATPSHNVTTKKNIKRKTFASNVSSGNVKRKKSVPKSANHSGSVSESSAAQSGTVGRSAAQSGTVGRSAARTVNTTQTQSGTVERSVARTVNTTQTQSGTVERSAARTVNTTQTQSDTVGRSSAHTKQTRSGTAGRSSAHTASSSSYTRSGNGTKRRSSMPKVKTTRADSAIEKQTIRRRTKHSWTVDIINGEGIISHNVEAKLSDMFNLKEGVRVIVEWDKDEASPYGNGAGLLAGVCGYMGTDYSYFSISFKSWPEIPESYFDNCWNNIFELKFKFLTYPEIAQRFVYQSLNKKWRESRLKLWKEFYDPTLSRNDLIENVPDGIEKDQWAVYVDYRLNPKTKKMCRRNKKSRGKQIPHLCGAKSLIRRKHEMEIDSKKPVGRGPLYLATHTKKGGGYTCNEAKIICEKILEELENNPSSYSEISPTDPVGKNHKKEYPGRVRSLGLGAIPSISFKKIRRSFRGVKLIFAESNGKDMEAAEALKKFKLLFMKLIRTGKISGKDFEETFGEPLENGDLENDESGDSGGSSSNQNNYD